MKHVEAGMSKPKKRSLMRLQIGKAFYSIKRYALWVKYHNKFAADHNNDPLTYLHFHHETLLLRQLKNVDMIYQHNKITNLKRAMKRLNGIILHPGEIFSYWKLLGKPTYSKGYVDGMVLSGGLVKAGCGGGLCQMSNLIYWMTLHTPLTVVERHRHGYDVFPDANRTQPFGSGATCFYPHGDLMIQNNTSYDFQLLVNVGLENLEGEWRSTERPQYTYEIIEKNHMMQGEYWGGFSRHNELYRQCFDVNNNEVHMEFVTENHVLMMYSPFLSENTNGPSKNEESD